ncbi:hypothetical protein SRHO_G00283960 [Serrasalmus rhombeus]
MINGGISTSVERQLLSVFVVLFTPPAADARVTVALSGFPLLGSPQAVLTAAWRAKRRGTVQHGTLGVPAVDGGAAVTALLRRFTRFSSVELAGSSGPWTAAHLGPAADFMLRQGHC